MNKLSLVSILFLLMVILASCSGSPKQRDDEPIVAKEEAMPAELEEASPEAAIAEEPAPAEPKTEETVLAEAIPEELKLVPAEPVSAEPDFEGTILAEAMDEASSGESIPESAIQWSATFTPLEAISAEASTEKTPLVKRLEDLGNREQGAESEISISEARLPVPNYTSPLPEARHQTPSPQAQISEARPLSPDPRPVISDLKPPIPDPRHSISEARPPLSDLRTAPSESRLPAHDSPLPFSRTVRAAVGQLVEVPFNGTGWVYLGEVNAKRGIAYDARRLDSEGQSFIFMIETPGTYALKFYRQDFIRDYIVNDFVQVLVDESSGIAGANRFNPVVDRGRVIAEPRWPSSLDQARRADARSADSTSSGLPVSTDESPTVAANSRQPVSPAQAPASAARAPAPAQPQPQRVAQAAAPAAPAPVILQTPAQESPVQALSAQELPEQEPQLPKLTPDEYITKAREEFDAGKVAAAISMLDQFCEYYPSGSDESLWLYGQFYEANSPSRNILVSRDYYRRLVNEYPQSSRASDARRRIAYLERFYININ